MDSIAPAHTLIRTEAGAGIGLGHVQRCLALAAGLRELGMGAEFLLRGDGRAARERIVGEGFAVLPDHGVGPGSTEDVAELTAVIRRRGFSSVVLDSYALDGDCLRAVQATGCCVTVLDDHDGTFDCDVVLNGALDAETQPYRTAGEKTTFLLGARYALLRPEYWSAPPRTVAANVRQLLITVGGSDPHGLLPRLLDALPIWPFPVTVEVVVGPFVSHRGVVRALAVRRNLHLRVLEALLSLREAMAKADVAVSAAGQTLNELAVMGVPTVAIAVADNQVPQLNAYAAHGLARAAGRAEEPGAVRQAGALLKTLCGDRKAREAMAAAGQRCIDGQGARRAARAIAERCGQAVGGQ